MKTPTPVINLIHFSPATSRDDLGAVLWLSRALARILKDYNTKGILAQMRLYTSETVSVSSSWCHIVSEKEEARRSLIASDRSEALFGMQYEWQQAVRWLTEAMPSTF